MARGLDARRGRRRPRLGTVFALSLLLLGAVVGSPPSEASSALPPAVSDTSAQPQRVSRPGAATTRAATAKTVEAADSVTDPVPRASASPTPATGTRPAVTASASAPPPATAKPANFPPTLLDKPDSWLWPNMGRHGTQDKAMTAKIRKMVKHAWNGYKAHAWGFDELRPLSKAGHNWLGTAGQGLAATMVDSLDLLKLLGFEADYQSAKSYVLNELSFDQDSFVSVFETNIRIVGGLLGAWELDPDPRYIAKAQDLVTRLLPAFDSPTRLPYGKVNLRTGKTEAMFGANERVSVTDLGTWVDAWRAATHGPDSDVLERAPDRDEAQEIVVTLLSNMTLLSSLEDPGGLLGKVIMLTNGPSYKYAAATDLLLEAVTSNDGSAAGAIADMGTLILEFGYLSDLTGNTTYRELAEATIQKLHKLSLAVDDPRFHNLYPELANLNRLDFASAKYGVGGMIDSLFEYLLKEWLISGKESVVYRTMLDSSLQAIRKTLVVKTTKGDVFIPARFMTNMTREGSMSHLACFAGSLFALAGTSQDDLHSEEHLHLSAELTETCWRMYKMQATGLSSEAVFVGSNFWPVGMYLLRPEVIESIFHMWRLTKDPRYRQMAKEIALSIQVYCKVPTGYAGLLNVENNRILQRDAYDDLMPSFFLAETLKYLYLIFEDDDVLGFDEFVFTTEGHALRVKGRRIHSLTRDEL